MTIWYLWGGEKTTREANFFLAFTLILKCFDTKQKLNTMCTIFLNVILRLGFKCLVCHLNKCLGDLLNVCLGHLNKCLGHLNKCLAFIYYRIPASIFICITDIDDPIDMNKFHNIVCDSIVESLTLTTWKRSQI